MIHWTCGHRRCPKIGRDFQAGENTLRSDPVSKGTDGLMVGDVHHIRRLVVILHGRERRQMVGMLMKTVDIHGIRLRCLIARRYMDPSTGSM